MRMYMMDGIYDRVHPLPSHLSVETASAIPCAGLTAYRALVTQGDLITIACLYYWLPDLSHGYE
jgi:NADPH:quinone reductase-like Zn-dependent oxidoreductase